MTTVVDPIKSRVAIAGHPLHPLAVHFPIALLTLVLGADLGYWLTQDAFWQRAGLWLAGVGMASGWFAALLGTADWLFTRRIRRLVSAASHAVMAVMMLSVATLSWLVRLPPLKPDEMLLPTALSVLGAVLLMAAGFLGGRLVYEQAVGVSTDD